MNLKNPIVFKLIDEKLLKAGSTMKGATCPLKLEKIVFFGSIYIIKKVNVNRLWWVNKLSRTPS